MTTDLAYLWLILQVTAGHVQRQIRSIETALQRYQTFRDQFRAAITDDGLVAEKLDMTFGHIEFGGQPWEIEDPLRLNGKSIFW